MDLALQFCVCVLGSRHLELRYLKHFLVSINGLFFLEGGGCLFLLLPTLDSRQL